MHQDEIRAIEERTGLTLTEEERRLLTTPKDVLGNLDGQRKYLLGIDLASRQCPACLSTICRLAALRDGRENIGGHHPDGDHWCPRCGARLTWNVAFVGDPFFTIHPSEARPVTS